MSAELQAAKELVSTLADDATQVRFDENGYLAPEAVDAIRTLLADHARLEGENERLRNELDDALHDYGNAESEAKGAEADNEDLKAALTEARREVSELREGLKSVMPWAEMGFYLWDACSFTAGDGYTQPHERTIEWQWQQVMPDDHDGSSMRADVEKFLAELTEDAEATPWVFELPVIAAAALLQRGEQPGGGEARLGKFWVSWWQDGEVSFELHSPWWRSGMRADGVSSICAAVMAADIPSAKAIIEKAHDKPVSIAWRFVEIMPDDWTPFNDRFRRADWMKWPALSDREA